MTYSPLFLSVRTRLALWSVFIGACSQMLLGGILRYTVETNLHATVNRELISRGHSIERRLEQAEREGYDTLSPPNFLPKEILRYRNQLNEPDAMLRMSPRLFEANGRPSRIGFRGVAWDIDALNQTQRELKPLFSETNVAGESIRVYTQPIFLSPKRTVFLQTVHPLVEVHRSLETLTYAMFALFPVMLLVTGIGAMLLTGRLLSPVRDLTRDAEQIEAKDLSQRLTVRGNDEFSRLARTFNAMLTRLEAAFERQKRFTGDASHELRTPLTAIKAHASLALHGNKDEAALRRALAGIDRASSVMNRVVQDLLLVARLEGETPTALTETISLSEIFEMSLSMLSTIEHAPISIELSPPTLQITGDPASLTRLFLNLVENAARHTPPEGTIRLIGRETSEDALGLPSPGIEIRVEDTGVGVSAEHLAHLGERFYRVDSSRTRKQGGTGLGLAICRGIVEAHGGTLRFESEIGHGFIAVILLPS